MYKYIFLIYLLFLNFNISAEIVKKIVVAGNERISAETIIIKSSITSAEP